MRGLLIVAAVLGASCGSGGGSVPDGHPPADAPAPDAPGPDGPADGPGADALPDAPADAPGPDAVIDASWACTSPLDCDDLSVCNGVESCGVDHVCVAGTPLDCADTSACTADSCDPVGGCGHTLIDGDGDGFAPDSIAGCGTDCNDGSAAIHPGATELASDGIDQDCDALELCFVDADGDGYRLATTVLSASLDCTAPGVAPATAPTGDCDDMNAAIHPGATEAVGDGVDENCDGGETCYRDNDNDGWRTGGTVASADVDCNDSGEAVASDPAGDCDNSNAAIHPGATEIAGDNVDQNCDGIEVCFTDTDNDGYRTTATASSADADCNDGGEAVASDPSGDCDDSAATVHPGAAEVVADGVDENCDGTETCFFDSDDDGYRTSATGTSGDGDCSDPQEALATDPPGDCNDTNATINPGASEITGNGVDDNCNGIESCFADTDNDGYRTLAVIASSDADCTDPGEAMASAPTWDCDDGNAAISPGAAEVTGDNVDENCDGAEVCFVDADNDGWRTSSTLTSTDADCNDPGEAIATDPSGDCADAAPAVNPGAAEICFNSVDDNCSATEDEAPECSIDCNWSGARWLSHGWDGGSSTQTGAYFTCTGGKLAFAHWVNNAGTMITPAAGGTGDPIVGCDWVSSGTWWTSQGQDGAAAFTSGATATCNGARVTAMNWEATSLPDGPTQSGQLGCDWTGAIFLSHGLDGNCAFKTGLSVTCSASHITNMETIELDNFNCARVRY